MKNYHNSTMQSTNTAIPLRSLRSSLTKIMTVPSSADIDE